MRLFFAVNVTPDVTRGIRDAIGRFPVENPPWRWVQSDNLHITLKFLGEMAPPAVPDLVSAAGHACAQLRPFELSFGRFGAFPNMRAPRVLFYGADRGAEELKRLAGSLETALHQRLGIERERRPFQSHITVARIKTPLSREISAMLVTVPPLEGLSMEIGSISLMHSELLRSGAVYRQVKEIAFA